MGKKNTAKKEFMKRIHEMSTPELRDLYITLSKNLGRWSSPRRIRKAKKIQGVLDNRAAAERLLLGDDDPLAAGIAAHQQFINQGTVTGRITTMWDDILWKNPPTTISSSN